MNRLTRSTTMLVAAVAAVGSLLAAAGPAAANPRCSHLGHTHQHAHGSKTHVHHWNWTGSWIEPGHHEVFYYVEGDYFQSSRSCVTGTPTYDGGSGHGNSTANLLLDTVLDPFVTLGPVNA